ncbi:MAG: hypothetical protein BGN94_08170 [Rhizobiales bacterium 68-8]|nr:MAG: hypothetical protein BGN94_08170 [Rhizobiales bacterium 68-8]
MRTHDFEQGRHPSGGSLAEGPERGREIGVVQFEAVEILCQLARPCQGVILDRDDLAGAGREIGHLLRQPAVEPMVLRRFGDFRQGGDETVRLVGAEVERQLAVAGVGRKLVRRIDGLARHPDGDLDPDKVVDVES